MPKKEINYSNTIIYKIVCRDLSVTECYVGHTTNFKQRKSHHKSACNGKGHNSTYKIYTIINSNGGWDNWDMVEVEKCSCNDINEAVARERHWYEQLNSKLNMKVPSRTAEEYRSDTADIIAKRAMDWYYENHLYAIQVRREHYNTHKDSINAKRNNKVVKCECGMVISSSNYTRHIKRAIHLNSLRHSVRSEAEH